MLCKGQGAELHGVQRFDDHVLHAYDALDGTVACSERRRKLQQWLRHPQCIHAYAGPPVAEAGTAVGGT